MVSFEYPYRLVSVVEQGDGCLEQRRHLDDLGTETPQDLPHCDEAAGHHLGVLLAQTLEQVLNNLLVDLDLGRKDKVKK